MCRSLVSIDWQGYLYDCDFNQMLGLPLVVGRPAARPRLADVDRHDLDGQPDRRARPLLRLHRGPGVGLRGSARVMRLAATCRAAPVRSPTATRRACSTAKPEIVAETLYVIGGLYGNVEALDARARARRARAGPVALVFNGDFHWFDVDPRDFAAIDGGRAGACGAARQRRDRARRRRRRGAGCGCAYPDDVERRRVARSNEILVRLRATARRCPRAARATRRACRCISSRAWATRASASCTATRPRSPAGASPTTALDDPAHRALGRIDVPRRARRRLRVARHTCLPALRRFDWPGGVPIANNGAAGMPNFRGTPLRVAHAHRPCGRRRAERLHGARLAGAFVEALRVDYDQARWLRAFDRRWPAGLAGARFLLPAASPPDALHA